MVETTTEKTLNVPEYELNPPTLYESQLFPYGYNFSDNRRCITLDISRSLMINFSGLRGSGKSTSLALWGTAAMAAGLNVWANFPIRIYLIKDVSGNGEKILLEAKKFDLKEFLTNPQAYQKGWILLDEYQDIASAYAFATAKNRLITAALAQIRKNSIGFAYGSKFKHWVDTRTRAELDCEIRCEDAHDTDWGNTRFRRGEKVIWRLYDWSGTVTRHAYEEYPITYLFTFYSRPIWGAFPTNYHFDIFESFRGIFVDMEKDVITDKNTESELSVDVEQIIGTVKNLFALQERWKPSDLFMELGIFDRSQQYLIKKTLRDRIGMVEGDPNHPVFRLNKAVKESVGGTFAPL